LRLNSKLSFVVVCAAALGFCGSAGMTPARAVTYDFTPLSNSDIGASASFTVSGVTITASGFSSPTFGTTVHLYSKNGGGDENGLGLVNDPAGNHEISGTSLIRISLPTGITNFAFTMGSSSSGEGWLVYGSNSPTSGYVKVASGMDENNHVLTGCTSGLNDGCFAYYYFAFNPSTYSAGNTNVLLDNVGFASAVTNFSAIPLPAALPLFASGLGALGLLGWRRKRKALAA
jgi:hypothetical protein